LERSIDVEGVQRLAIDITPSSGVKLGRIAPLVSGEEIW